ncbi:MAG: CRISPR-associated endonuclease Cas2 [Burkholderiales bacterium]
MRRDLCLVAYDIARTANRRRAATIIENYGDRVLESVYMCFISNDELHEMQSRVREIIKPPDRLLCWPVCAADLRDAFCIGRAKLKKPAAFAIV